MLTKIVLSALLVAGFATTALAEDPEANLGDRYPFLEQSTQQQDLGLGAYAYAPAPRVLQGLTADEEALFRRADELQPW